jgi:tetratricopeptide (TPR) repeat protein
LSSATGVATPFILIYHRKFNNCHSAEKKIHTFLEDKGVRFNDSREFFEISTTDAIHLVQTIDDDEISNESVDDNSDNNIESVGMMYFEKGNNYYSGENGCFQDYNKALEYYNKAIKHGVIKSHFKIGQIHRYCRNNVQKAINEYQKGAEQGDIGCYPELAGIYMSEENFINEKNAILAWEKFCTNLHQLSQGYIFYYHKLFTSMNDGLIHPKWHPTIQFLRKALTRYIEENELQTTYLETINFFLQDDPNYFKERFFKAFLRPIYEQIEDELIDPGEIDPMFMDAAQLIVQTQMGSTSLIQRKLRIGYNRTGRLMDQLEEFGIVGPSMGSKAREIKVKTNEELMGIFQRMGLF